MQIHMLLLLTRVTGVAFKSRVYLLVTEHLL